MGGSSGGSAALIMAWYHPELYHRVLTYSGTYVNQQYATLTVIKSVVKTNGGTAEASSFTLRVTSTNGTNLAGPGSASGPACTLTVASSAALRSAAFRGGRLFRRSNQRHFGGNAMQMRGFSGAGLIVLARNFAGVGLEAAGFEIADNPPADHVFKRSHDHAATLWPVARST